MSTMRIGWQMNIIFMVLLITSCFGGPVIPPKKTATTSNNVVVTAEATKLASDAPKLEVSENPKPAEPDAVKAAPISSFLNYKIKFRNSTSASNQVVSQAVVPGENNASAVSAVVNPSAIPPAEITDPDAGAGGQAKTEGDNLPEAAIVNDKTANVSDSTVIENNEAKVNQSITTKEANESNMTTKDETKPSVIAEEVNQEQNTSNSDSPALPSVDDIKSTVSEDKKGNTSEPESENDKVTEPKLEPSVDSQSNGSTHDQEQSTHSESNIQPENQEPSIGSDSNTQTDNQPSSSNSESNTQSDNEENSADSDKNTQPDNQQPSLNPESNTQIENKDVSLDSGSNIQTSDTDPIETVFPVQASKVAAGKSSISTPSSFNINYGDASATYQQNSDSDYSSFDSDNKNGMSSSNDIIEDDDTYDYDYTGSGNNETESLYNDINADKLNREDAISYDNERGPYENERGAYENQQQKLSGDFTSDEDSHFFAYFLTVMVTAIVFYLLFHNKQRIIALIIEGRSPRSRRTSRGTRYHKLDNNFEEAMVQTKGSTRFDGLY